MYMCELDEVKRVTMKILVMWEGDCIMGTVSYLRDLN